MKLLTGVVLASFVTLTGPTPTQMPRRDGAWEITVDIEMEGVEKKIPSRTVTQCVTPDDVASGKNEMPGHAHTPGSCSASDHKVDGNKVSWSFKCDAPQPMSGTGEIVYTDANSYQGTMTFVRDGKTMIMKYAGKRLGDCTK